MGIAPETPYEVAFNRLADLLDEQMWRIVWLEGIALGYGALTLTILAKSMADSGLVWVAMPLVVIALPMYFFGGWRLVEWTRRTIRKKKV